MTGSAYLDFITSTATQVSGWEPQVEYAYPVFSTASRVTWNPIMRSLISISVNILNADYGEQPISLTSESSIGFEAAMIEEDGGTCSAGELMMTSYSNVQSSVVFSGQQPLSLYSTGDTAGSTLCFSVPNDIPTADEVSSLRSVGAAFCTNYLDYNPPTAVAYGPTTITTPSIVPTTGTSSYLLTLYRTKANHHKFQPQSLPNRPCIPIRPFQQYTLRLLTPRPRPMYPLLARNLSEMRS